MKFPAKQYLNHYYNEIGTENNKLLSFYAGVRGRVPQNAVHLEIGCGPTIYQLISIAPNLKKIIYTDASIGSLRQIKKWLNNDSDAFNWDIFIQRALELEKDKPIKEEVLKRATKIRSIESKLLKRNLSSTQEFQKIGKNYGKFDSISANGALEAIATTKDELMKILCDLYAILNKGGVLNIIMIEGCRAYQIGNQYFKTLHLTRKDFLEILIKTGFEPNQIIADYEETENKDYGYQGIMFYSCIK